MVDFYFILCNVTKFPLPDFFFSSFSSLITTFFSLLLIQLLLLYYFAVYLYFSFTVISSIIIKFYDILFFTLKNNKFRHSFVDFPPSKLLISFTRGAWLSKGEKLLFFFLYVELEPIKIRFSYFNIVQNSCLNYTAAHSCSLAVGN